MGKDDFMKGKLHVNDVFITFYSFLIFNIGFTSIFPKIIVNLLTVFTFIITLLLFISMFNAIHTRMNSVPFILFIIYILLTILSAYLNRENGFYAGIVSSTIKYIMILTTLFLSIIIIASFGKLKLFFVVIFYTGLAFCLINDIIFLPHYKAFISSQAYLLHSKFQVAYTHLELLALYLINIYSNSFKLKKSYLYILIIFILSIDLSVDCITGITGLILFVLFFGLRSKKLLKQPLFWLAIFTISAAVPFLYQNIVDSSIYQNFVLGSLNRGLTMNGRINIYKAIPYLMYNHWQWGYGYGSSYAVVNGLISMPDMQNGFMELVVQVGLITAITFVFFVFFVIRTIQYSSKINIFPLLIMIYVYTILGSFEITFSVTFFFICMIIYVLNENSSEVRRGIHF